MQCTLGGALTISAAKQEFIDCEAEYHLCVLCRQFNSGELDEENLENADGPHFIINMDTGEGLGFKDEQHVKWADVASGGEGRTMVVGLSGGRNVMIQPIWIIFKNKDRRYPIRGVDDEVPGVDYRTGPQGWMDLEVLPQWLEETRVIWKLPGDRERVLYVDNCSGHKVKEAVKAALDKLNTEVRFSPRV